MAQSTENIFKLTPPAPSSAGPKIWTLCFNLPGEKVNKLSRAVIIELESTVSELENLAKQNKIDLLFFVSGKPANFIAGADIDMIRAAKTASEAELLSATGQKLMNRWEDLPFPTVAAIDGPALGGGCEFALSCTAMVMSNNPSARIGLPEVMLGLIPGLGGCVRLPRKVGLASALDMILTSRALKGEQAVKLGLAEACLPKENFEDSALKWARANFDSLKKSVRLAREPKLAGMGGPVGTLMEKTPMGRAVMLNQARKGVLSKTKGHYPAPLKAIEVLSQTSGYFSPRVRGIKRDRCMAIEAKGFGECAGTEISKNLIRIFFLTESVKKSKGLPPGVEAKSKVVSHAAGLGAGVMGGGVAQLFAEKGIPTRMKDLNNQALALGVQSAGKIFEKQAKTRRITRREYFQKMNLISPTVDFAGFKTCDLVVEAIVENMEIKRKVLKELEKEIRDDCVIVSNTSSLSVSKMQGALQKPERFAGMHFFNPVHRMPLIEVIRGAQSSDEAVTTVFQLAKQMGKTPIVVKDAPGFLVNRLLAPYMIEACYLLSEGVPILEIDRVLLDFGMPMGPMELLDEVGVDVGDKVAHILYEAFGARMLPGNLNSKLISAGHLGKKSGKGFYTYAGKEKKREFDTEIYSLLGVTPGSGIVSDEEILERTLLPMINEASRCLEDGIVATPNEVDLGMIMGMGFPPFRGGLLRYADTFGAKVLVEKLLKYETRFGPRFEASAALKSRAQNNQRFYKDE